MLVGSAILAVIAVVAPAFAKIPVTLKSAPVDTTEQNAPTSFRIVTTLGGSEHIKDLVQRLPAGLGLNTLNPTCPVPVWQMDKCAANTQVGTTTASLTAGPPPGEKQMVSGRIFFLDSDGPGVLPGLGIILDAPSPFKKAFQRGTVKLNTQLGVLETTIRDFPRTAETQVGVGVPIRIDALDVLLNKNFVTNPPTCEPATTELSLIHI